MILAYIQNIETADNLLQSAYPLSKALKKTFGIIVFAENAQQIPTLESEIREFAEKNNFADTQVFISTEKFAELSEICEKLEASFLFLQLTENRSRAIQKQLNACRGLRIPYVIYKDSFPLLNLEKVMMPVTFLEEEYEKAQFASAFGRFCNSQIYILLANDYGSKAQTTADKMIQLFDKFQLTYSLTKGINDSFKVEKESVQQAENENFGLVLLSASRDYGLDDTLFGPKEQHLVKKSTVPVLLVNPRGDLYALCD